MRLNDPERNADSPRDADQAALAQRLRELATEMRPPFTFGELQRRMGGRGRRHPAERWVLFAGLAAAAALVGLVLVAEWRVTQRGPDVPLAVRQGVRGPAQEIHPVQEIHDESLAARPASLDAEARAARIELSDREPAIVRVSTRLAVTGLEDRIASLDDVLNNEQLRDAHDPRLSALRRERAQMLSSLAQVRYAEDLAAQLP
jgi:hypothetical protein